MGFAMLSRRLQCWGRLLRDCLFGPRVAPIRSRRRLQFDVLEDRTLLTPNAAIIPGGSVLTLQVVLISDAVAQAQQVRLAAVPEAIAVVYPHESMTVRGAVELLESLSAAQGGARIGHLAVVAHGGSGQVAIGANALSLDTLAADGPALDRLQAILTASARFDLVACSVAQGTAGKLFVDRLAEATGADVYASDDPVGASPGSDLVWEYHTGQGTDGGELLQSLDQIPGLSLPIDTTPPTVNLSYPDSGTFTVGQTITIQGSASDASGISHVQIELYKGGTSSGNRVGVIFPGNIGDGNRSSYSWQVPSSLNGQTLNGSDYKIKWVAWDNSTNHNPAGDYSTGWITLQPPQDTTPPSVDLISPDSGTFTVGQTININGNASDPSGISHVQIELYKGGTSAGNQVGVILPGNIGDGNRSSYSWQVPSSLNGQTLNGSDYKIK
ncbi:MAG: DUF4347 domain-containing protein, partial [Planctomycetes bacterium]|nr:DUF4347 domain-containing protein [Planctomycetota bacterium]